MANDKPTFYEFFAGGGMARLGLQDEWCCVFANDFSARKARSYRENFAPADELIEGDVHQLSTMDLPGTANLAWASFPCQDLSLAGNGVGLSGHRSGSFWGFWRLISQLGEENRYPSLVVLENVTGTITANNGRDFQILLRSLVDAEYRIGPLVVDGQLFVPQSRPRLFIVGVHKDLDIPVTLTQQNPDALWHPRGLIRAKAEATQAIRDAWVWWDIPYPPPRSQSLLNILEEDPTSTRWHTENETQRLLSLMTPLHQKKVREAQLSNHRIVGAIYRRIRTHDGEKAQRAEVRFDDTSGCLRTGSGGSSRQFIMVVEGDRIRTRLLSTREAARLMGVPDSYTLPENYNEAYHLMGDGLVVPVVKWLSDHVLFPLVTPGWFVENAYPPKRHYRQPRLLGRKSVEYLRE